MIYGNIILENQFNELTNTDNIMQNYYENEISFLNSIISYQNEMVTESCSLEVLHEGFLETIKNKIKELISKFITWLKNLWSKFTSLFKKKIDNTNNAVVKVKDTIKRIESSNLSKEEKELKKEEVVNKLVKSNNTDSPANSHDNTKQVEYKSKKYRYYFINKEYIFSSLLKTSYNISDFVDYLREVGANIDRIKRLDRRIDNIESTSLDEAWEEFTKTYYYRPQAMTPDQILKTTEENIENYKDLQESFEKRKKDIDKEINNMEKLINNLPKDIRNENLNLCYNLINKYITANEKEIAITAQFIAKLGSNLKVVEVND